MGSDDDDYPFEHELARTGRGVRRPPPKRPRIPLSSRTRADTRPPQRPLSNPLDPFDTSAESSPDSPDETGYDQEELGSGGEEPGSEPRRPTKRGSYIHPPSPGPGTQRSPGSQDLGTEEELLQAFHPQVEKRRRVISALYNSVYTNPSMVNARRERQTLLSTAGPAQSAGERGLRQTYEPPIDDEESERQVNNDRGLLLACPVPPPGQLRIEQDFPETDQMDCFGCMARIASHVSPRYDALKDLVDFYKDNVTTPPHILAVYLSRKYDDIREAHNDSVQRHYQDDPTQVPADLLLPVWDKAAIYQHITKHISIQPSVFVRKNFARLEELNEILVSQGIYRLDPRDPQRIIVNNRCAELLLRNIMMQQRLLSTPLQTMNFHDPGVTPSTPHGFVTARGHLPPAPGNGNGGLFD